MPYANVKIKIPQQELKVNSYEVRGLLDLGLEIAEVKQVIPELIITETE